MQIKEQIRCTPNPAKKMSRGKRPSPSLDDWERGWLEHWSKASTTGSELPKSGELGAEAAFLTETRTSEKEKERLDRIQEEFVRGFEGLYELGPAVTVFGSARFNDAS